MVLDLLNDIFVFVFFFWNKFQWDWLQDKFFTTWNCFGILLLFVSLIGMFWRERDF